MTSILAEIQFIYVVFRFPTSTKARQLLKMGPPLQEPERPWLEQSADTHPHSQAIASSLSVQWKGSLANAEWLLKNPTIWIIILNSLYCKRVIPRTPGHFALLLQLKFSSFTVKLCSFCCHTEIFTCLAVKGKIFFWCFIGGVCGNDVQLHPLGKHFRPVREKNSKCSAPTRIIVLQCGCFSAWCSQMSYSRCVKQN